MRIRIHNTAWTRGFPVFSVSPVFFIDYLVVAYFICSPDEGVSERGGAVVPREAGPHAQPRGSRGAQLYRRSHAARPPAAPQSVLQQHAHAPGKKIFLIAQVIYLPVLGIPRNRMFLGLPDPDPLVKCGSGILPFSHKGVERTEIILAK
jgi:hypothetical protein